MGKRHQFNHRSDSERQMRSQIGTNGYSLRRTIYRFVSGLCIRTQSIFVKRLWSKRFAKINLGFSIELDIRYRFRSALANLKQSWRWLRRLAYGLLVGLSCLACLCLNAAQASLPASNLSAVNLPATNLPATASGEPIITQTRPSRLEQGQQLYENGQLLEAAQVLQQAADAASTPTERIVALRNLALVYQQLGDWSQALTAIATAQSILDATLNPTALPNSAQLQAQLFDVQGGIQLDQGQGEAAILTWQQAVDLYTDLDQADAARQAQINQAQAMQQIGFHRQAIATLLPIVEALAQQPDSLTKAVALRTLGDSLLQAGSLEEAQTALKNSLAIATTQAHPATASAALLSLGNLRAIEADYETALEFYDQASSTAADPLVQAQAQLNRLDSLVQTNQISSVQANWSALQSRLDALPPTQAALFAKIKLAQVLMKLPATDNPTPRQIADILATTVQQAQTLGDQRSESLATGTLAHLYELQSQWSEAETLTQTALRQAQDIDANDIAYQWQWQLGRIFKAEQQIETAIAAYDGAVNTLKKLRTDLVAVNSAVQVSFQDSVEPIHREFISLLLDPARSSDEADVEKARTTIESLQLAELDNFFREACLDAAEVDIDQLDPRAAVVYPLILADRLEIILSLPDQPLRHYASLVTANQLNQSIEELQQFLVRRVGQQYMPAARQIYDWIIRPLAADLANSEVDTLVFVLDGELRNIPMAVLNDGSQFLLEQYNLALTPGLQLVNPKPIQTQSLRVLTAGLSESRQGFSALPYVVEEVDQIQSTVPASAVLLNEEFTTEILADRLTVEGAPVVHLATHGKFSSTNDETFVLTWDGRLDINSLNNLLQTAEFNQNGPIELLVLSACQTAAGDKQAALGMAGMAVRAGARSTVATLWQVNDEATALLMSELYNKLTSQHTTKAAALRQAQLKVLQEPQFRQHPFFWAPYVLVGNWL